MKHIWKLLKLNLIKKEKIYQLQYLPFLFHTTVLQYTQSRIHRPKLRNKICSFIFCWIRNNNFGFGSRQKFRIRIPILNTAFVCTVGVDGSCGVPGYSAPPRSPRHVRFTWLQDQSGTGSTHQLLV